jgi:antitoxin component of MazEF toxin-antitoxin module
MERVLRESGNCKTIAIPPAMLEFLEAKEDKALDISYGKNGTLILSKIKEEQK